MNKKILIVLFIVLALAIGVLIYLKKKATTVPAMTAIPGGAAGSAVSTGGGSSVNNLVAVSNPVSTGNNTDSTVTRFPLSMGSQGRAVKMLQAVVGVPITGLWDSATDVAIRNRVGVSSVDLKTFAATINATSDLFPVQQGDSGTLVAIIQILVGATPDGIYGPQTQAAVQAATGDPSVYGALEYINLINSVLGLKIGFSASTDQLTQQPAVIDSYTNQLSYL